ncbi:unnamed protein product, partial [Protopolystoma xenopodis]
VWSPFETQIVSPLSYKEPSATRSPLIHTNKQIQLNAPCASDDLPCKSAVLRVPDEYVSNDNFVPPPASVVCLSTGCTDELAFDLDEWLSIFDANRHDFADHLVPLSNSPELTSNGAWWGYSSTPMLEHELPPLPKQTNILQHNHQFHSQMQQQQGDVSQHLNHHHHHHNHHHHHHHHNHNQQQQQQQQNTYHAHSRSHNHAYANHHHHYTASGMPSMKAYSAGPTHAGPISPRSGGPSSGESGSLAATGIVSNSNLNSIGPALRGMSASVTFSGGSHKRAYSTSSSATGAVALESDSGSSVLGHMPTKRRRLTGAAAAAAASAKRMAAANAASAMGGPSDEGMDTALGRSLSGSSLISPATSTTSNHCLASGNSTGTHNFGNPSILLQLTGTLPSDATTDGRLLIPKPAYLREPQPSRSNRMRRMAAAAAAAASMTISTAPSFIASPLFGGLGVDLHGNKIEGLMSRGLANMQTPGGPSISANTGIGNFIEESHFPNSTGSSGSTLPLLSLSQLTKYAQSPLHFASTGYAAIASAVAASMLSYPHQHTQSSQTPQQHQHQQHLLAQQLGVPSNHERSSGILPTSALARQQASQHL